MSTDEWEWRRQKGVEVLNWIYANRRTFGWTVREIVYGMNEDGPVRIAAENAEMAEKIKRYWKQGIWTTYDDETYHPKVFLVEEITTIASRVTKLYQNGFVYRDAKKRLHEEYCRDTKRKAWVHHVHTQNSKHLIDDSYEASPKKEELRTESVEPKKPFKGFAEILAENKVLPK